MPDYAVNGPPFDDRDYDLFDVSVLVPNNTSGVAITAIAPASFNVRIDDLKLTLGVGAMVPVTFVAVSNVGGANYPTPNPIDQVMATSGTTVLTEARFRLRAQAGYAIYAIASGSPVQVSCRYRLVKGSG